MTVPFRITCKRAHVLMSEQMDRPLKRGEHWRLWLHLRYCVACSRVERHMQVLRAAMRRLGE